MVHLEPDSDYPPDPHLLRDLCVDIEQIELGRSNGWVPMQDAIRTADGTGRIGAVATLIDCVGGAMVGPLVYPGWMATADLSLEYFGMWSEGPLRAEGRMLRAGRSTVVLQVDLFNEVGPIAVSDPHVGRGHLTFAVLPKRDHNPDMGSELPLGRRSLGSSGCAASSILDALGSRRVVVGTIEADCGPYANNTLQAMHGGAAALLIDAAASDAAGEGVRPTSLSLTYLARATMGPVRASAEVVGGAGNSVTTRVRVRDLGANRDTALAWVRGTRRTETESA